MRKKVCGSVRWSRHRKDGAPKKLVAQQGGLGTGRMVRLRNFCGSVRWSRHRKDGAPKKLLWLSKVV